MRIAQPSSRVGSCRQLLTCLLVVGTATTVSAAGSGPKASLLGSGASLDQQNTQARQHDFTYLQESRQVHQFVKAGLLVPVKENSHFILKDVSFPYARPEVKLFVTRLAAQYRSACGERLVITSLTRPITHQPSNASPRSVHPTGMALDLRRPTNSKCRNWLESTLLYLEERLVIEATRERGPPHYHVAVFPKEYASYVQAVSRNSYFSTISYTVKRRDTLWRIAKTHGTTPQNIQRANHLHSTVIRPGQVLHIPEKMSGN